MAKPARVLLVVAAAAVIAWLGPWASGGTLFRRAFAEEWSFLLNVAGASSIRVEPEPSAAHEVMDCAIEVDERECTGFRVLVSSMLLGYVPLVMAGALSIAALCRGWLSRTAAVLCFLITLHVAPLIGGASALGWHFVAHAERVADGGTHWPGWQRPWIRTTAWTQNQVLNESNVRWAVPVLLWLAVARLGRRRGTGDRSRAVPDPAEPGEEAGPARSRPCTRAGTARG